MPASAPAVPSGYVLEVIVEADAVGRAVAQHRGDQVREVADGEREAREPALAQLVDDDLDDRAVSHRQKRLRQDRREWPEPRALAAGQDHRPPPGRRGSAHATAPASAETTSSTCCSVMCAIHRQRDRPRGVGVGDGQVGPAPRVDLEAVRRRVVEAGLHALLGQRAPHAVSIDPLVQDDGEEVVGERRARGRERAPAQRRARLAAARGSGGRAAAQSFSASSLARRLSPSALRASSMRKLCPVATTS